MPSVPRFAFHGTAAALSGRIMAPTPTWLDPGGASALPVEGGVSTASIPESDFAGIIHFKGAATHAQGDRHETPVRSGARRTPPRSTQAHTGADVWGLTVKAGAVAVTVGSLCAELTALCDYNAQQPSIGTMDGACFDDVRIGRHRLIVTIDRRFFKTHDTHDKLCALCDAPHARRAPRAVLSGPRSRGAGDLAVTHAPIVTTIVKSMRWQGRPFPRASIDHHVLTLPGVGQIYFGEMLVSGNTRRLTMMRVAFAGPVAVEAACCEVEAGGTWHR